MSTTPITLHRPGRISLQALPPLSLYVHLPWCLRKCPYCDFNSHQAPDAQGTTLSPERQALYIDALIADLESSLPQVWGRRVHTVFIGGGTPSLFSPDEIERLLAAIRARLPMEPGAEITLEANPGTFEKDRFKAYQQAGVTRLSIGVQSFDDAALAALGRVHDAQQARAAVAEAASVFETFNIDLMYALPGQDLQALEQDLRTALAFKPKHLSVYHLTLEPNTLFANEPPKGLPDQDLAAEMMDRVIDATGQAGLQRYEVSAYAQAGHRCDHNLNYWTFGDYLGIGAGAHGKLSFPDRIVRQVRWRDPATYEHKARQAQAVSNETVITPDQLPFEFMLNALRLVEGVPSSFFVERTGLGAHTLLAGLEAARRKGLIDESHPQMLRASSKGLDFLSDLQALFLPA